jgi:periplasmic protein TonB
MKKMERSMNYNHKTILLNLIVFLIVFNYKSNIICGNLTPGEDDYVIGVEKMPSPVGGIETILKKIVYPSAAKNNNVEGKVYLLVYINENGGVDDVKLVKGIGSGCEEEAINVIKKTKFNPGVNKGVNVKTKMSLSIPFKL